MTLHPVRVTGLVVGAPQTYNYFADMQKRIVDFICRNSSASAEKINELIANRQILGYLDNCKYTELFNDKVMGVYGKREFINSVESYISNLNSLLENNPILNERFTEQNAETLGKELAKHNLFDAHHTIRLKDGVTEIHSLEEWNAVVNTQLERLYTAPELSTIFQKLKRMLFMLFRKLCYIIGIWFKMSKFYSFKTGFFFFNF